MLNQSMDLFQTNPVLWQEFPDCASNAQHRTTQDQGPITKHLPPRDLLAVHLQMESHGQNDTDEEAEGGSHDGGNDFEGGHEDGEQDNGASDYDAEDGSEGFSEEGRLVEAVWFH